MKQLRIAIRAAVAAAPLATAAQTSSAITTFPAAPTSGQTVAEKDVDVNLVITSATSREDLAEMQRTLYPQGIKFHYSEIAWTEGRLTDIRVLVSTTSGKEEEIEFNGITADQEIRLVVRGSGDAQQLCIGTDCDRKFPRRD
jgi:hypothetical protein